MATTPAVFKLRFTEFASEEDARIQLFLDDAALQMNETHWGDKYDIGQHYLAAHFLWLNNRTSGADGGTAIAPIASKTVDGVNITYVRTGGGGDNRSGLSQGDVFLTSSSYGQQFMNLRKNLGTSAFVV